MLNLHRVAGTPQDSILITAPNGNKLRIVVTKMTGPRSCNIGIDAPREYKILREELADVPDPKVDKDGNKSPVRMEKIMHAKIEDIQRLKAKIPRPGSLCQLFEGTRNACEAETMVGQTIHAAVITHAEYGEAFSYRGKGCSTPLARCGTDNATAYGMLISRGYFEEGEHDGKVTIIPTQELVDLLDRYFTEGPGSKRNK